MGRSDGAPQEAPAHPSKSKRSTWTTEVTNAEYGQFVRETNYAAPTHWAGPNLQMAWNVASGECLVRGATPLPMAFKEKNGVSYAAPTERK